MDSAPRRVKIKKGLPSTADPVEVLQELGILDELPDPDAMSAPPLTDVRSYEIAEMLRADEMDAKGIDPEIERTDHVAQIEEESGVTQMDAGDPILAAADEAQSDADAPALVTDGEIEDHDPDPDDYEMLTRRQLVFVAAYLDTRNATAAYMQAYNVTSKLKTTIWPAASKVLNNPKVRARIEKLDRQASKIAVLNHAWVLEQLMHNVARSRASKDFAASNKALELIGKTTHLNMFVERQEHAVRAGGTDPGELSPLADWYRQITGAGGPGPPEAVVPDGSVRATPVRTIEG